MSTPGTPCIPTEDNPCTPLDWWWILLIVLVILSLCAIGVCHQQKVACFEPEEKKTSRKRRELSI